MLFYERLRRRLSAFEVTGSSPQFRVPVIRSGKLFRLRAERAGLVMSVWRLFDTA